MDRTQQVQERTKLEEALRRARVRVASASHGSPDWDAAMAAIEDIESRLLVSKVG